MSSAYLIGKSGKKYEFDFLQNAVPKEQEHNSIALPVNIVNDQRNNTKVFRLLEKVNIANVDHVGYLFRQCDNSEILSDVIADLGEMQDMVIHTL